MKKILLMLSLDLLLTFLLTIPHALGSERIIQAVASAEEGLLIGIVSYILATWLLEK